MPRALIVEDESPLRRILALNLARRGYTVAEAGTVADAEETLQVAVEPFDVVLLDLNLPDQTGWDVLRFLAERGATMARAARPHVIVMTAVRPAQRRIDEFHPDAVLLKPFPIETLLRLLGRVCDNTPPEEVAGDDELPDAPGDSGAHRERWKGKPVYG